MRMWVVTRLCGLTVDDATSQRALASRSGVLVLFGVWISGMVQDDVSFTVLVGDDAARWGALC